MKRSRRIKPISYVKADALAMLKIMALGEKQVREGRTVSIEAAMQRYRVRVQTTRSDE